jgi:hypothetical protein
MHVFKVLHVRILHVYTHTHIYIHIQRTYIHTYTPDVKATISHIYMHDAHVRMYIHTYTPDVEIFDGQDWIEGPPLSIPRSNLVVQCLPGTVIR